MDRGAFTEQFKISRVNNAAAAGTSDVKGTQVDMQANGGWDGVVFIAALGTLTATQVTSMRAQQSPTTTDGDFADLAGSATAAAADGDSNKLLVVDVQNPTEQYVRPVVDRATANAVIDGIFAIQYRGRSNPFGSQSSTISALKALVSAGEGTA